MPAQKDATDYIAVTPLVSASNLASDPGPSEKELKEVPDRCMLVIDAENTGGDNDEQVTIELLGRDDTSDSQVNVNEAHQGANISETISQGDGRVVRRVELADVFRHYQASVSFSGTTPAFDLAVYLVGTEPIRAPITQVD